ncbi:MAG: hypothetical protein Q9203_000030 [Teloschistes exilis]
MVTQPASEMLEKLCRGPVLFWIDSLCIKEQVALMAYICSKASLILVWLGPDPYKDTEHLFNAFKDLVEKIGRMLAVGRKIQYLHEHSAHLFWTLADGPVVYTTLPPSAVSPSESEAERLSRFFNLPWFSRSWVLQEGSGEESDIVGRTKTCPIDKSRLPQTVHEVYREVALEHTKRTVSLEMLTAVQHDCDATVDLPFPSWVPQWNKCNGTQPLRFFTSKHFASANRDAIVTLSADTDPGTLIARGTIVSKVVYTSSLCQSSSFDWALKPHDDLTVSANSVADSWLRLKFYLLQVRGEENPRTVQLVTSDGLAVFDPESDILTAYMRTWVAGKNLAEVDGFDFENDVTAYWHCLWASPREGTRNCSEDHLRRAERYRASAAAVANQRKLFVLRKGLIGLGPGAMRKGDWVAVLLGADVPFVIREIGGEHRAAGDPFPDDVKFQLVRECYVDGLMTGGAVRGVEVTRDTVLV